MFQLLLKRLPLAVSLDARLGLVAVIGLKGLEMMLVLRSVYWRVRSDSNGEQKFICNDNSLSYQSLASFEFEIRKALWRCGLCRSFHLKMFICGRGS
jgi:hypothetical protein